MRVYIILGFKGTRVQNGRIVITRIQEGKILKISSVRTLDPAVILFRNSHLDMLSLILQKVHCKSLIVSLQPVLYQLVNE